MPKFWDYIHDDSGGRVLRLEGPIDSDSFWGDEITPQDFRDELYAEDGDLTLWINSPGGNVFAAAEIYTMIRDYPHNVTVRIASIAASAASVIAMAGNTVQMSPTALLMIHDPSTIAFGNAKDMEKAIATGHGKSNCNVERGQREHHQRICRKDRSFPKPHQQAHVR